MSGPTRGITIAAWAIVVVQAGAGWAALFAVMRSAASGVLAVGALLMLLLAGTRLLAGLRLLDARPWARRWLVYSAVAALGAVVAGAVLEPPRTWFFLDGGVLAATSLVPLVLDAVTLYYFTRPRILASFPPDADGGAQRLAFAALAVVAFVGSLPGFVDPPRAERSAGGASSPSPSTASEPILPGVGPVVFRLLLDDAAVPDVGPNDVELTLIALEAADPGTQPTPRAPLERPWRVRRGHVRVRSVPAGVYSLRVVVDQNHANGPGQGGDLIGGAPRVELRTAAGRATADVPLRYAIGLGEPFAPADPVVQGSFERLTPAEFEALPRLGSPAVLAWDAVPGAAEYRAHIQCRGEASPREGRLSEPGWSIALPVCGPPHPWVLNVIAYGADGGLLGVLPSPRAFVVEGTPRLRQPRGLRPAALTLRPTFDGRAVAEMAPDDIWIELFEATARPVRRQPRFLVRHGRIKLPAFVPGTYHVTLVIGPDAGRRGLCRALPGSLTLRDNVFLRDPPRTDWRPETRVVPLQRTMHLLEPSDDGDSSVCSYGPPVRVASPVTVRWAPMAEAAEYRVQLRRWYQRKPDETVVPDASWTTTLPRSGADDFYTLTVTARAPGGREVGTLHHQFIVQ